MSQQKNFFIYHVACCFFSMIFNVKTLPSSLLIHDFKYIIEFVTRVTRQVSLVDQELLTLPEHLSSTLVISGVCVARSLVSCVVFCRLLFVFFLLAIVLSFLLLFTDCDYSFGIFKPFLQNNITT